MSEKLSENRCNRCEVCDWPLAESRDKGCVPGDCSYRPEAGSDEWRRIKKRREELAERDRIRALEADLKEARGLLVECHGDADTACAWYHGSACRVRAFLERTK